MWKDHHCYGYKINHTFCSKVVLKGNGLVFHLCLYNKWNMTWLRGDTNFLSSCIPIHNMHVTGIL